jgi:hypothetical protein
MASKRKAVPPIKAAKVKQERCLSSNPLRRLTHSSINRVFVALTHREVILATLTQKLVSSLRHRLAAHPNEEEL